MVEANREGGGSARPTQRMPSPLLKLVVHERQVQPRHDILSHGQTTTVTHLLLEGFACRYRLLSGDRRQITAILVPGDLCDLDAVMAGRANCSAATLSVCRFGEIPSRDFAQPHAIDPKIAGALWRSVVQEKAIACEWLLNLGRREAPQRAAHLFCELRVRLQAVGLAQDDSFEFPLTQPELGDVLGLSSIHVNRVLRALREAGFVRIKYGWLTILDAAALEQFAEFDPTYLQDA